MRTRLSTILTLAVAILAGSAPWRVCNHADAAHAHVWLPSASAHGTSACGAKHASPAPLAQTAQPKARPSRAKRHLPPDVARLLGAQGCLDQQGDCCGCQGRHGHGDHESAPRPHDGPLDHAPQDPHVPECPQCPDCPDCPEQGHCHCTDQPLVTGSAFRTVAIDAPALTRAAPGTPDLTLLAGAPEVAPLLLEGSRVPHESDPIVLLR